MKDKDITEKHLEDYNDVFSDIVNVLLFNGKDVVGEDELENTKDKSQYKAENEIHEQERDVTKYWKKGKAIISLVGIENQSDVDKTMPIRVIGYDGAAYRAQLLDENRKEYYPVITLVLYYGKRHWKKNRSLYQLLDIPKELTPYVNDYRINVFEISYLTEEQIKLFKSDFRIVADFFVQTRKNEKYIPTKDTIKHVDEVLKLMSVLTGDNRFLEVQQQNEGGAKNMCDVIDSYINTGIQQGIQQGLQQGIQQTVINFAKEGVITLEEAAKRLDMTVEEIEQLVKGN